MNTVLSEHALSSIGSALLYLDDCPLECDGMTYAISYLLKEAGIAHRSMIGAAVNLDGGGTVFPHCWIELSSKHVIDFRLRMWLGDYESIPHGVFDSSQQRILYRGEERSEMSLGLEVLSLLTEGKIHDIT